jgi:RNA polymerase sigma-70 factor (ECF subfamily)
VLHFAVVTTDALAPDRHVPGTDPDADIIDLTRRGERHAALRMLMRRHGSAVYRFCREQLRDDARAADVQQNVFIAAHRDLPGFEQRSSVKSWLFGIARHRVLDNIKAHTRTHRHVEYDDTADIAQPGASPAERLDDARLHEALAVCVSELSEEVREAVLLRFQQGFTFEEMAEICCEKAGTLQARVSRAMAKLRACVTARTGGAP